MRSSLATLNIFYGGQTFPVTAPVTAITDEEEADGSRQTLRFLFRLPASAPAWPIDRMVLRWRGTEVELPPPAPPVNAEAEPSELGVAKLVVARQPEPAAERLASEAQETPPDRYGAGMSQAEHTLALLQEDIVTAKLELAQLHADIAQARLEYEEASMATEYAQKERDRAQQWVRDVTGELEDVERRLAVCRQQLDQASREIAARTEVEPSSPPQASPDLPAAAPAAPRPEEPHVEEPAVERDPDPYAEAQSDLNAALSQLRSRLDEVLSTPRPVHEGPESAEQQPRVRERPIEESVVDELFPETPAPDAPSTASEQDSTPPVPASLPGPTDREDGESSWFAAALRRMAQDDREAAGQVLVSVLPAQAIATPRGFHYDLVVRDDGVYAVDAHPLDTRVQRLQVPRPMDQTDAWIMGSLEQLGDLIARGKSSFRRVFGRHGVKVKGQRARVDDLLALATAPLRLRDLCAVGAPIQPQLLLQMIVSSIEESWIGERPLSIRFDPREEGMHVCSVRIQDGAPMVLGSESTAAADFGELTTIAEGSARSLMRLLAGLPSPEGDQANIRGPVEPLELLQSWVKRLELTYP